MDLWTSDLQECKRIFVVKLSRQNNIIFGRVHFS